MIDLKQKELADWEKKNFGRHDDDVMRLSLGMAEEVGEICHHVMKGTQKIRGGINGLNNDEIADGVADTLIYGMQLLTRLDMDAEEEIAKVIEKVLQRDWKKNPEGDKKNIQKSNADLYNQEMYTALLRSGVTKNVTRSGMNGDIDTLVKELAAKKDSLIKEAITFMIGEDWSLDDIRGRGRFVKHASGGPEVFSFDGKALLEFYGIDNGFNPMSLDSKYEVELKYKKLYDDECPVGKRHKD